MDGYVVAGEINIHRERGLDRVYCQSSDNEEYVCVCVV